MIEKAPMSRGSMPRRLIVHGRSLARITARAAFPGDPWPASTPMF